MFFLKCDILIPITDLIGKIDIALKKKAQLRWIVIQRFKVRNWR